MRAVPYQSRRSAAQVDRSLRRSLAALDQARQCAVLWFGEVMRRKLFREFGCSSVQQYARERLGFSSSRTRDFVHLARKLENLPAVKSAVASGELGYTKAREVVKVATPRTEQAWLTAAQRPRLELVKEVKRARKAAAVDPAQGELMPAPEPVTREVPVRFAIELTPEQEARRAALVERLHKLGAAPTGRAELLLDALAALVEAQEAGGPRGPSQPVWIHIHERGAKLTVATDQGERELGPADSARLRCDAVVCRPGKRAKATIPPRIRREVLARDDHRCQAPGCGRAHFLEVHHKQPRARGGTNDPTNLVTLCAACHRLHHERGSLVREPEPGWEVGSIPGGTAYRTEVPGDPEHGPHRRPRPPETLR